MTALDLTQRDTSVRPQDDLFRYCNGLWLDQTPIDADKSSASVFVDLHDAAETNVRTIIEGLARDSADPDEARIARLYALFMDEEQVERESSDAVRRLLEDPASITSPGTLASYLGRAMRTGGAHAFHLGEEADPGTPSRYAFFLGQGGLGLPDEEYYRLEEHAEVLAAYRAHVERMLELAGAADAAGEAEHVLALETKLATLHWDKVRCRDLVQMFNPMSWDELSESAPGFDWEAFRAAAHVPTQKVSYLVVEQPSFVTGFAELASSEPIEAWRAWARWHVISARAPYLGRAFVETNFDFYGRMLSGAEELRPRWKRAIGFVEGAVGESLGRLYVAKHFRPEAKARMDELVANLIRAYEASITTLPWMSAATKEQALAKLAGFTPKIGYPDRWRDYSSLDVSADLLVDTLPAICEFDFEYALSRVLGPLDPSDWAMLPQTVNAYYHPLRNEIVFPAAILQPPFFNLEADDAVNYGAIGAVIGHEIGHGFDDKGSTTDAEGRLRDWWTPTDKAAFEEATGRLVEQFDGLSPKGVDGAVNGRLTLGENIGDLGGVGIAYKAWLLSGGAPDGESIDGFTPEQRFFLGYAQVWRTKRRPELAKMLLSVDPHSPAEFRVNQILKNVDAFHEAFGTRPGDGLWLEPAERVAIW